MLCSVLASIATPPPKSNCGRLRDRAPRLIEIENRASLSQAFDRGVLPGVLVNGRHKVQFIHGLFASSGELTDEPASVSATGYTS